MPNQSATQPPQNETWTKKNPNCLEWKVPTLADLLQRLSVSSANPPLNHYNLLLVGESAMKNKMDHPHSHEEREAETLVTRIEKQASQEAAREAETKRTLDDYAKTVGS
jgi:hypothetical protein